MNKKLLAVAIAGALAAPYAMADEGNVTISGNLSASVSSVKTKVNSYWTSYDYVNDEYGYGEDSRSDRASDVSPGGSDLTISGWENLGNGLKAVFLLKTWVNVTGNAGGGGGSDLLFGPNKDAYLGLQGNFGTVALGAHGQPYKTATDGLELFGDTIGDARGSVTNGLGAFHSGIGDAVIWFLPNMNGFSGHLQYGTENGVDGGANPWGAQFNYSNGPLYVTYAHADNDAGTDGNKVGVGYSFGDTTVNGIIERTDNGGDDVTAWSLGLAQKFGANTLKAQYARNDLGDDQSLWALGLDHSLSKRTTLFALYADGKNMSKESSSYSLDDDLVGTWTYTETQFNNGFEVGIKHSF
ncbi:MAG: porin [Gammaproteobacteria bacterium]|nr:porin [Gammaproteobacteria bacterium]